MNKWNKLQSNGRMVDNEYAECFQQSGPVMLRLGVVIFDNDLVVWIFLVSFDFYSFECILKCFMEIFLHLKK